MSLIKNKKLAFLYTAACLALAPLAAEASEEQVKNSEAEPTTSLQAKSAPANSEAVAADKDVSEAVDAKGKKEDERTAQEKIAENRRVLNLDPPKAPKSLGGGNGNGGLGSGQISVSSN